VLLEQRIYTVAPGKLRTYLAIYETDGVKVHTEILGHWLGCYVAEVGTLNQVVHLWGFADFEQRAVRRARLMADPRWQAYLAKAAGLVVHQENRLLLPAGFTPVPDALTPSDEAIASENRTIR
jgi:hypothetical protein